MSYTTFGPLERTLAEFRMKQTNGLQPEIIIMHPEHYHRMVCFIPEFGDQKEQPRKYHGIDVLRSYDLKEDDIRIY